MRTLSLINAEIRLFLRSLPKAALVAVLFFGAFFLALPKTFVDVGTGHKLTIAAVCELTEARAMLGLAANDIDVIEDLLFMEKPEALTALDHGEVDAVVVIPGDLISALINAEQAVIDFYAKQPEIGAIGADLLAAAARAINAMQNAVYAFEDQSRDEYPDYDAFYDAENKFIMRLLSQVFLRGMAIKEVSGVSPYLSHILTLGGLVFAICLAGQSCIRMASEANQGFIRRLLARKIGFFRACSAKFIPLGLFSGILSAGLGFVLKSAGMIESPLYFCAGVVFAATSIFFLAFPAALLLKSPSGTAMFCMVLFIGLAFSGGGFYPVYLMNASFRTFNPVWLCRLLMEKSLGGAVSLNPLYFFACLPAIVLSALCWRERS